MIAAAFVTGKSVAVAIEIGWETMIPPLVGSLMCEGVAWMIDV